MKTTRSIPVHPAEVTPEHIYLNRRQFLRLAGLTAAAGALAACGVNGSTPTAPSVNTGTDELGSPLTSYQEITTYNNYYEFTTDKSQVAELAKGFKTSPWQVEVGGLVKSPRAFSLEELVSLFPPQERIYRLRCVEAWSMVIPWLGFPLASLLKEVEPTAEAQYVRFTSAADAAAMPGIVNSGYPFPYTEGLRLDEAMHDLTLLGTGLYAKSLPAQSGGPIRLVVPWKYGFKNIKSIVKIELTAQQPATFWGSINPQEYGFYANVNPQVPHPRWSQATEFRLGENAQRDTLLFNGYGAEVAALYDGMDLKENY
jgi:sulfoxide reductase catalytic subunit YedY